jgi:hypothetical protein
MRNHIALRLVPLLAAFASTGVCLAWQGDTLSDKLAEGSVWSGIAKSRLSTGSESSADAELTITKRDGNVFEGRMSTSGGSSVVEIKGTISGTRFRYRVTKVVTAKAGARTRNLVGVQSNGQLRRNGKTKQTQFEASSNWADQDDPTIVREVRVVLSLNE